MPKPLSQETIDTVKLTIPALEAHGVDITTTMYKKLFETPAVAAFFNQTHQKTGTQPEALANAILAYAKHIENPAVLADVIGRIAQKHVSLQVKPEHYPIVAEALLGAIKTVLGNAATPAILDAWEAAYWFLADVLIGEEKGLYTELEAVPGGWEGWREFEIESITKETSNISSFVLLPRDGKQVLVHTPGQYLTFWLEIPGHLPIKRNYSISSAPNCNQYRITVKRIGLASEYLHQCKEHEVLKVAAPVGDFTVKGGKGPIVMLSAGIGITPAVSMLQTLDERPLHLWYSAANPDAYPMREVLSKRLQERQTVFYSQLGHRITVEWIGTQVTSEPLTSAEYYICGPAKYMEMCVAALKSNGIPSHNVHYEFFSPEFEYL